jgi:Phosphoglucose isomerase N-terminal domain/Bacterial phospho-glucose isomerase C-terminal SIS domain
MPNRVGERGAVRVVNLKSRRTILFMLDSFERYELDTTWLARALEALPGSYDGPVRLLEAPYGVVGFGEGAWPAEFARRWIDAALVTQGTQFVLSGGFDFGEAEAAGIIAEASGSTVYRVGLPRRSRRAKLEAKRVRDLEDADGYPISGEDEFDPDSLEAISTMDLGADEVLEESGVDYTVPASPFSAYHYLQALCYATGRASSAQAADQLLLELRDQYRTDIPTDENPAKRLAWSLWTRTPLLMATQDHAPQIWAWHNHISRLGKSMSIPLERNPLTVIASGFEARHESGDALVALTLGGDDEALRLVREVLETRIDEVIAVPAPAAEPYAAGLGLWYLGAWVGFYLAMLYGTDPKDSSALERLRDL